MSAISRLWPNKKEGLGQARVARLPVSTQSRAWAPLGWHFHLPIVEPPTFLFVIPWYLIRVSLFCDRYLSKEFTKFNLQRLFVIEPPTFLFIQDRNCCLAWVKFLTCTANTLIGITQAILTHGKYERSCNRKTTGIVFVYSPYMHAMMYWLMHYLVYWLMHYLGLHLYVHWP